MLRFDGTASIATRPYSDRRIAVYFTRKLFCRANISYAAIIAISSGMAWTSLAVSTLAKEPFDKKPSTSLPPLLGEILQNEANGQAIQRREVLSQNIAVAPEVPVAKNDLNGSETLLHWHSGDLQLGKEWKSVADLAENQLDERSHEYLKLRGTEEITAETHRKLAKWCQAQGLDSRAKAHWFGVLDSDPSNVEARQQLGYTFLYNRWFSPQELSAAKLAAGNLEQQLKQWIPKAREWKINLESNDVKKRLKTIEQLKNLQNPDVIPALDIAAGQANPTVAKHFISAIGRFQTREACIALAGIAIANTTSELGTHAIEILKKYPLEFYVPDLLDLMSTEYELMSQLVTRPNGEMVLQLVQMRELRNRFEKNQIDKLMAISPQEKVKKPSGTSVELIAGRLLQFKSVATSKGTVKNDIAASIISKEAKRDADDAQAELERTNESIRSLQQNIATVLRGTTNAKLDDEPRSWWIWWDAYEESYNEGDKPYDQSYIENRSSMILQTQKVQAVTRFQSLIPRRLDCLALGTQIQTESGLKSIENIQIGDLVVAQNIGSGQLSLRPVLRTTRRPEAPTRDIRLSSGETIRATLGHPWWVTGKGWVKTKNLQKDYILRTPEGFEKIDDLQEREPIETLNLVIDEDHTFFVGQSRLLSSDATELIPTFQRVPGLAASKLLAK